MSESEDCPIADDLFDDLRKDLEGSTDSSGVAAETLELFVEQFSTSVLDDRVVGLKHRSRGRLEHHLSSTPLKPSAADVLAASIDCARELSSQFYAPISGFFDEYLVPWLESIVRWLREENGCEGVVAAAEACLETLE